MFKLIKIVIIEARFIIIYKNRHYVWHKRKRYYKSSLIFLTSVISEKRNSQKYRSIPKRCRLWSNIFHFPALLKKPEHVLTHMGHTCKLQYTLRVNSSFHDLTSFFFTLLSASSFMYSPEKTQNQKILKKEQNKIKREISFHRRVFILSSTS